MNLTEGQLLFRLQDFHGAEQEALGIGDYEFAQEGADIACALRELLQARRTIEELTAVVEQRNGECVRLHSELESRAVTVKLPSGYVVRPGHPINEGERGVMIPKDGGTWLSRFDVEHMLRVAGIQVIEGDAS